MIEVLETIALIFIISVIIYAVKDYQTLQKKVKGSYLYQGILFGCVLIVIIIILTISGMLLLNALNNFGIIELKEIFG